MLGPRRCDRAVDPQSIVIGQGQVTRRHNVHDNLRSRYVNAPLGMYEACEAKTTIVKPSTRMACRHWAMVSPSQ
jgi:hypothetical protein